MAQEPQRDASADALGEKLNTILSDPDSMQKLIGMASGLAQSGLLNGLLGGMGAASEASEGAESEDVPSAPAGNSASAQDEASAPVSAVPQRSGSGPGKGGSLSGGKHAALLRALRPYLGSEKQERIDRMMKLLQLAEIADTVLRP